MNKFVLFSLIGIFLFSTGFSALTDNLVIYYTFDNVDGVTIDNEAGVSNDGTLINGATLNATTSKIGSSLMCDGVNDWLSIDDSGDVLDPATFSFNFWVYLRVQNNGMFARLQAEGYPAWYWGGSVDKWNFYASTGGTTWNVQSPSKGSSTMYVWQMMTLVKNTTDIASYKNGVLYDVVASPTRLLDNNGPGSLCSYAQQYYSMLIDEFGFWENKILTQSEITELYNSGNAKNPLIVDPIYDYNVTEIQDNSSILNNVVNFNTSYNLNFTGWNGTTYVTQNLTMEIIPLNINRNITSGVYEAITFNNVTVNNYTIFITNPYNSSVNLTTYYTINDIKNITLMNTTTFYKDNTTQSLNFSIYLNDGNITCDDYFNLTISLSNISNQLVKSCALTSINFNNSAVYNYTAYLTNNRFSRTINNTQNFYTTVYNISSVTYLSLPVNGSYTTITENVGTRINGTGQTYITYIERNGTNYTNPDYYFASTTQVIETIPFNAWLNVTYNGISYMFNETHNQTITNIVLAKCNASYLYNFLNTSFKEEITRTAINMILAEQINFEITLTPTGTETDLFYTFTETKPITTINLCSNYPLSNFTFDSVLKYYTDDGYGYEKTLNNWRPRNHFYLSDIIGTNSTKTQNLYLLLEANSQIETFTVKDEDDNYLKGYYITLQRAYGGIYTTSNFETVAMMLVGEDGKATTYVDNTAFYIIKIFTPAGTLYYTSNAFQFGIDTTYSLTASSGTGTTYLASVGNYQTNALLNLSSCIITLNALNTGFSEFDYKTKIMMTNGTIIEETGTTSELTQAILIPDCTAKSYWIILTVSDDNNDNLLLFKQYVDNTDYYDYSDMGVFLTFIMIAGMGTAGLLVNPKLIPVLSVIGLIVSSIVGLMPISWIVLSGLLIGSILLIWVIK